MRPIDLAQAVGLSTQAIRNYADAGVLPHTERTAAGYRIFGENHYRALVTYRALARGHGSDTARSIMQAVHDDDVPRALAIVDESHASLHEQRQSLRAVTEALETIARQDAEPRALPRAAMLIGEVAAHLGVRTSTLRVWESAGLLTPQRTRGTRYRTYGPVDVRDALMIQMLRRGHYPLPQIRPILDDLRQSGGTEALRAATAQRQAALTARTTAMLDGAGHLHGYITDHSE